jgi:copper transport protein
MNGRKQLTLLLILIWLLTLKPQPAFAHAVPITSEPAPNAILDEAPPEITIRFNEPVVPDLSRISVLTQAGQALATGTLQTTDSENRILTVAMPDDMNNGAYLVSWQVLSAVDGHTTSGTFSFGVGVTELTAVSEETTLTAIVSPLNVIARWLTVTAITLIVGREKSSRSL